MALSFTFRWMDLPKWLTNLDMILSIPFESEKFPPQLPINGEGSLKLTAAEVAWSAISSGIYAPPGKHYLLPKSSMGLTEDEHYSFNTWRVFSSLGFLEPEQDPADSSTYNLVRSRAFDRLESTELGQVDYAIGSMLTRAFTCFKMDFPYLLHLSWLKNTGQITFTPGNKSRPDYVAFDANSNVAIVEAKGRKDSGSWNAVKKDLAKKLQVGSVTQVAVRHPVFQVGCAALIPPKGPVELYAVDPEPEIEKFEPKLSTNLESYFSTMSSISSNSRVKELVDKSNSLRDSEREKSDSERLRACLLLPKFVMEGLANVDNYQAGASWYAENEERLKDTFPNAEIMPDLTILVFDKVE